jgi:hypothetical protein
MVILDTNNDTKNICITANLDKLNDLFEVFSDYNNLLNNVFADRNLIMNDYIYFCSLELNNDEIKHECFILKHEMILYILEQDLIKI